MSSVVELFPRRSQRENPPLADALSFVTRRGGGGGFRYWRNQNTGNLTVDYQLGRDLADEFITFLGKWPTYGNETLLALVFIDMIKETEGQVGGVERSFFWRISRYTTAGAVLANEYSMSF